jgi:hypothetical protein
MSKKLALFCCFYSLFFYGQLPHCGFDFTSYIVVNPHEIGQETAKNILIYITNEKGELVLNFNNQYSWNNTNKPLEFTKNYKINKENEPEKWFFPYAKDSYLIAVVATFPAENFYIKVKDLLGSYKEQIIPLQAFNLYVLCASENEKQARSFGPRSNYPIEVILEKK